MNTNQSIISVGLAGSTNHSLIIAKCLADSANFKIEWILTPGPKPIGRKQILTANPLDTFATEQNISVVRLSGSISPSLAEKLPAKPDLLIVVDFGYLIPDWLLAWPKIAPINIHSSRLPEYRGSSPGQFLILDGASSSAGTVMVMNEFFDQGPILGQAEFAVSPDWNSAEYYLACFDETAKKLPAILTKFCAGEIAPKPQPAKSPTTFARRLTKNDSFISWEDLMFCVEGEKLKEVAEKNNSTNELQPLLKQYFASNPPENWPIILERAVRAFSPWPKVWTLAPTKEGEKRLIIHSATVSENTSENTSKKFIPQQVQLEGKSISNWNEIKNNFS